PVQEQDTRESYAPHSARPASGIPGATSNLQPLSVTGSSEGSGQYTNTRTDRHYVVSKVVQRRIEAPGKIRRLSIAVLLDQTIGMRQQEALKSAFAAAAGLEMESAAQGGRGDRIELLPMKFDRSAETAATRAADSESKRGFQAGLIRNGAAVLIVVLVLIA